jgi:VCBS repeat-containing protein
VLAVVCSAEKKQASIYGQATINRSGSYFFKIDAAGVSVQAGSSC